MVFEHKQTQTLADGTHINVVSHEYFYRDNLGRTRIENEFITPFFGQSQPIRNVSVRDPVGRTFITWETGGTNHTYRRIDETGPQATLPVPPARGNQPHTVAPVRAPSPPAVPRPTTTTEALGALDMQGLSCDAVRTSFVYPIDFMGNDRPITVVTERCQSREFGRELLNFTEDPRTGTSSTRLESVSREAPDPSLFVPPPNYIDAKAGSR